MGVEINECPQCQGTKLKVAIVPSKIHPSRMREVLVHCDCFYEERTSRLLKAARIPERYAGEYKLNFHGENESRKTAEFVASKMVQEYSAGQAGLLFVGPVGIGKTHLACAVLQSLISKGYTGLFYSYADLLTEIRNTYNDTGSAKYFLDENGNRWETESQILNHVTNVDVLLLDELGKVRASEWVLDKVREIIGGRYNKKRTTLATTNYPLDTKEQSEIILQAKIGEDMVSRLREMCRIVEMEGPDYRKIVKRQ
jgi:DNA replication protein DnaC